MTVTPLDLGADLCDLEPAWQAVLAPLLDGPEGRRLGAFLAQRQAAGEVLLPPRPDWFNAFRATPLAATRVVILGQDPYPTPGHAHGLCFSVRPGVAPPRSLKNIFRELADDLGVVREDGCLEGWARQGVLLLNTVLTVSAGQAGSHRGQGWEAITDAVVAALSADGAGKVFVLWGGPAQKQGRQVDTQRHRIIAAPHPSPLSARRGFFGSRPFSRANALLAELGRPPVDWRA